MNSFTIIGMIGATVSYLFIAVAIALSPWFNIYNNALSDLGNLDLHGSTGWIFNTGLILGGLFTTLFSILLSIRHRTWKYLTWTIPLTAASIDLSLVGFFSENVGSIHGIVSVILFTVMSMTMLIYSYVSWPLGSPRLGAAALVFGVTSVMIWVAKWPWQGVAIQETVTSIMTSLWIIMVSLRNV